MSFNSELAMGRTDGVIRRALTWAAILGASLSGPAMAQTPTAEQREHAAALGAHHICAGVFVVGRDYQRSPAEVLAQDLARFRPFLWQEGFRYTVDRDALVDASKQLDARLASGRSKRRRSHSRLGE